MSNPEHLLDKVLLCQYMAERVHSPAQQAALVSKLAELYQELGAYLVGMQPAPPTDNASVYIPKHLKPDWKTPQNGNQVFVGYDANGEAVWK